MQLVRRTVSLALLAGFSVVPVAQGAPSPSFIRGAISIIAYDGVADDLLTAGLGKSGLAGATPAYVDPAHPTAAELRRNAIYVNYRALVDMTASGGYGIFYGPNIDLAGNNSLGEGKIGGTEYIAYADDGSGKKNVTLMVQVPDDFNRAKPCIVTGTSSGSRGVYGAIGTSGDWGLKKGCAVAYADKGTGMGVHDLQNNTVNLITGVRTDADATGTASNFTADLSDAERAAFNAATPNRIAFKHAHSQQNPEKDWGKHTLQAVEFAFWVLNEHHRDSGPRYKAGNTIVIASSVSNGGAAAIRAAEQDREDLIDGVAVSEPNVQPLPTQAFSIVQGDQPPVTDHSKALFDYFTLLNLYQPCASLAAANAGAPFNFTSATLAGNRCLSLKEKGLLTAADQAGKAEEAQQIINAYGLLTEQNVIQPSHYFLSVPQSIVVTYANTYGRFSVADNLCGFSFGATDASGNPVAAAVNNLAQVFALGNGIPPTAGVNLINNNSVGGPKEDRVSISPSTNRQDMNIDGALCLRSLATGKDPVSGAALSGDMFSHYLRVATGVLETRASGKLSKPAVIVHGRADAIVAPNHASRAYFGLNKIVKPHSDKLRYVEITNAQHLDALNGLAGFSNRMLPLHVYFNQALNLMYDHLTNGTPLPPSQVVHTTPRAVVDGVVESLNASHIPPISSTPAESALIRFSDGVVRVPD